LYNVKKFGKIAVLAGGPSSEREISLKSGRAVYDALKHKGCDVEWLELGAEDTEKALRRSVPFDIAFIALHGRFGEDGTIQKILERMSIPYTGSGVIASRLALDKIASRRIFKKCRIPVPEYKVLNGRSTGKPEEFSWPVVVKPRNEGSSIGLSLARNTGEFKKACENAFKYSGKIIMERYIKGREITVGVLGDRALPVVEIIPKRVFYDFHAKYKDVRTEYKVPAPLQKPLYKKAQNLGLAAHNALNCRDFSRVDMLLGEDNGIYILEVNSIPGLTERSLLPKAAGAFGITFSELCLKLLQLALKNRYNKI
jgi:D-alanine-D-alanine ligase